MKAFHVFLFLALIGLVFAEDTLDRTSNCTTYFPTCGSCTSIIGIVIEILGLLGCVIDSLCSSLIVGPLLHLLCICPL
ncbi:hypothetical protein ALC60_11530 [Trachymyrmex zeteki]|uniref:Uncharacterized protein n=1 Tax=Mycetomoellerius zeteki TaxID=64791 RepID=A0A151WNI0_9HYME|nr:hypothetical protein ALC60_11530 [Trachymyrmex zeteki]